MSTCIETMKAALEAKNGVRFEELDYKETPYDEEACYNASLSIGNINLMFGRYKTKKSASQIIDKFVSTTLP